MSNIFAESLRGETALWKVFWIYGVIPSNALLAAILGMVRANVSVIAINMLLIVLLVYTAWIVISVWRCSDNVEKAPYGILARWLVVAWAVNTLLFVPFMALDLAA